MKPKLALFAFFLGSCAFGDAAFVIQHPAPDALPDDPHVSVFGLFADGHLTDDHWKHIASLLAPAFGGASCTLGYNEDLHTADTDLYEKIDHDALDDGVTDTMLKSVDAHATGNVIFAITVTGDVPSQQSTMAERAVNSNPTVSGRMGHTRARGPVGGSIVDNAVEITAMLYSVEHHTTLTTIVMRYTGTTVDDAFRAFANKLRTLMPGADCATWKWKK